MLSECSCKGNFINFNSEFVHFNTFDLLTFPSTIEYGETTANFYPIPICIFLSNTAGHYDFGFETRQIFTVYDLVKFAFKRLKFLPDPLQLAVRLTCDPCAGSRGPRAVHRDGRQPGAGDEVGRPAAPRLPRVPREPPAVRGARARHARRRRRPRRVHARAEGVARRGAADADLHAQHRRARDKRREWGGGWGGGGEGCMGGGVVAEKALLCFEYER